MVCRVPLVRQGKLLFWNGPEAAVPENSPKGHYIHGKGIQPDIKLEYKYSGPEDESYDMKYDNQLQKAISVVKEKIN